MKWLARWTSVVKVGDLRLSPCHRVVSLADTIPGLSSQPERAKNTIHLFVIYY